MISESEHRKLNEKKWDAWAGTLDKESRRNRFLRDGQRRVVSLLEPKKGMTFLDIGCGTGWAVNLAARSVEDDGTFYGVDLSSKMIEKAKENFRGRKNLRFIVSDSKSIPLEDNFFDVIICTHSFHHYLNPQNVMNEIKRLLKKGGRVYILDPTTDSMFARIIDKIIKMFEPDHVKMYSTEEFKNMFAVAGLKYDRTEVIRSIEKIHIAQNF